MTKLKQLTSAGMLISVLAFSAFAGDIQIPGPPPPSMSASTTTEGGIYIPRSLGTPATSDPAVDVALNLLQSVLSIF